MSNGRFTPKKAPKELSWKSEMAKAIAVGSIEAVEVQAIWCKDNRVSLDALKDDEDAAGHVRTCPGEHRVLFVFEPVDA